MIITTDGSFGDIAAVNFEEALQKTVMECEKSRKAFLILVNTSRPDSQETIQFTKRLEAQYGKTVMAVNCKTMDREDVFRIMEQLLADFSDYKAQFPAS